MSAWATACHGVISWAELAALGVPASQRDSWVRTGRLVRIFRGVYAVGHTALKREGWWRAAILTCGRGAVLSHESSAQLLGHLPVRPGPAHVTSPRRIKDQRRLRTHTAVLDPRDVTLVAGLPTTRAERTLVDLAPTLPYAELRALADRPKHLDVGALRRLHVPGRHGAAKIARLLERDVERTASELERRYARFCRAHGLPLGARNVFVGGFKVDVRYDQARIVVELDGRAHHRRAAQMHEDRRRDRALLRLGWHVVRLVWDDLDPQDAARTAAELRELLARQTSLATARAAVSTGSSVRENGGA